MSLNPQNVRPGQEQYEEYTVPARLSRDRKAHKRFQYDYRHTDGRLFACTAPTLEDCRAKRDAWLAEHAS